MKKSKHRKRQKIGAQWACDKCGAPISGYQRRKGCGLCYICVHSIQ